MHLRVRKEVNSMSAHAAPSVTLADLTNGPSIDSKTISLWLQISFATSVPGAPAYYQTGGVPSGVAAYAAAHTIDTAQFLQANIQGEETVTSSPSTGGVFYKYIPSTDCIQIFDNSGTEFTSSEVIPAETLNDTIVGKFTYNRL